MKWQVLKFDWDELKHKANIAKHQVTFQEAKTVFDDERAIELFDEEHSETEDRFTIVGRSSSFRELMVCHCYRGKDENIIRIISAREATKSEKDLYWRSWNER